MEYDGLYSGLKISEQSIEDNKLIESRSIGTVYKLVRRRDLTAQSAGVRNTGTGDASNVYQLQDADPDIEIFTAEYAANQTATEIVAAPGVGKRIVIVYGSIRTESTSGEANLHDGGIALFKCYFSAFTNFATGNLHAHLGENQALKITSTQGSKKLYVAVQYFIAEA